MKNILLVINDMVLPNKGGGAPRLYAVARAFKRLGYNPIVFCPLGISEKEAFDKTGIKFISMYNISRHDFKKIIKYAFYNPILFLKILKLIKKYKTDLIFVHNAVCGFPSIVAGKLTGTPVVFDPTDFIAEFGKDSVQGRLKKLFFALVGKFEAWTIKKADKVISNTLFIKNYLEKRYNREIDIVYDGVNLKTFYPDKNRNDDKFVAVLQGGMDPQDGLEIIIPCIEKLKNSIPNFELWIVGDGKILPSLKRKAQENNLDQYFKYTGWVSQDEVRKYISNADVGLVILPNRLSGWIRITLRTFEYWACNLPIIAPNLSSMREVTEDKFNCLYYEVGDSQSLADKIYTLYKDSDLREKIKQNGFVDSKKFDDNLLADKIVNLCVREFF